jgi:hypothetical protein
VSADVLDRLDEVLDRGVSVERVFATELLSQPAEHRRVLVAALRSACGDEHRRRLAARGMDEEHVRESVARTVRALLSA